MSFVLPGENSMEQVSSCEHAFFYYSICSSWLPAQALYKKAQFETQWASHFWTQLEQGPYQWIPVDPWVSLKILRWGPKIDGEMYRLGLKTSNGDNGGICWDITPYNGILYNIYIYVVTPPTRAYQLLAWFTHYHTSMVTLVFLQFLNCHPVTVLNILRLQGCLSRQSKVAFVDGLVWINKGYVV